MKTLLALAAGAAAGFAYSRISEARAHGVPWQEALRQWKRTVVDIKMDAVLGAADVELLPPGSATVRRRR